MNAVVKDVAPFARIIECSEKDYHSDPCDRPSLNQSIAKVLVGESALHAWQQHPKLGQQQNDEADETDDKDTAALADGKIIHKLLLGAGTEVEILDFANYKKKVAQEARDYAKEIGRQPILRHKYDRLVEAAEILRSGFEVEHGIKLDGQSEVAFEWDERGERGPVRCRARMDHVKIEQGVILDLKSIRSAHPDMCRKHMEQFRYDIQHAAYVSALEKYRPELAGRIDMRFLFMEIKPPFAITPVEPSGMFREIGRMAWDRAIDLWSRCLATHRWPAYTDRTIRLEPSPWFVTREMGSQG